MSALNLELLNLALDASISGIIITDNMQPDSPIIYCNKAFEDITGYERKDIIGHNCRFLQMDDRNQKERLLLREAIQKGQKCVVQIRNYKKDGTLFFNELYMAPVKDEAGKVKFFIGVQNDVTRRKRAEIELQNQKDKMEREVLARTRQLAENEEFLNSIVQTVRESLIVMDSDLVVLSVNNFFLKTFKVSAEESVNKKLYDLGNGQWNIAELKELLEKILPTNNPVENFEVQHEFPHIGKKRMLLNAHRIELEGSYKDRILLAIEDITVQREIEQRKDDFLSIASHELKTPLTTIKGYLQIISKKLENDSNQPLKELVDKADVSTNRLHQLINELLDVSRIQSGMQEEEKKPIDFDKVVSEVIEQVKAAGSTHQIELRGHTEKTVMGNGNQLTQVLNNLLSNAIKYSPGKKSVTIHLATVGNYIKCSVIDDGIGIHHDDQKSLFDRFFRVAAIQKSYPGMGVGLYVAFQIIKNHGGSLWVESEIDKGSSFSFTLPIHVHAV